MECEDQPRDHPKPRHPKPRRPRCRCRLTEADVRTNRTVMRFYELAAELIYPVKEGMSAGILVLRSNRIKLLGLESK